jgi:hypothetical protein
LFISKYKTISVFCIQKFIMFALDTENFGVKWHIQRSTTFVMMSLALNSIAIITLCQYIALLDTCIFLCSVLKTLLLFSPLILFTINSLSGFLSSSLYQRPAIHLKIWPNLFIQVTWNYFHRSWRLDSPWLTILAGGELIRNRQVLRALLALCTWSLLFCFLLLPPTFLSRCWKSKW